MEAKRKLSAILCADVAGYSRLMADDETATLRSLNDARALFRERIQAHGGRLIDTAGDSILAEFPSAVEAVDCAVKIQHELAKRNAQLAEHRRMQFRIGINLGDVIEQADGTIYGDGVNVAARLQGLAESAGLCISGTAYDQVEGKLPLQFKFIGEQQVKNIAKPVRAYKVLTVIPAGGSRQTHGSKRRSLAIVVAALIVVFVAAGIAWKIQRIDGKQATQLSDAALAMPSGPSIAVLAFDNLSGDAGQDFFADGITEELITSLSRFRNLRVAARHNTFRYKGQAVDTKAVGRELRARYIVEGSVRRSSDSIRVTAQLIEADSGSHVWADTYQRPINPSNILDIQQDIASKIAAAIGGDVGAVAMKEFQQTRGKTPASLSAYECNLRSLAYSRTTSLEDHKAARDCLERVVETEPEYSDAWANLAMAYVDEDRLGYNTRPGALDRALRAAERAVQLAPENQTAQYGLAFVHFFRGERDSFVAASNRAVALNPNNSVVVAEIGLYLAYIGQWEKGLGLLNQAMALEPNPPGWYYFGSFFDHYRKGEYEAALAEAQKMNMPDYVWAIACRAAAYGQLGRVEEARQDVKRILELNPDFETTARRKRLKWFQYQKPLLDQFLDGLRKAGLTIPSHKDPSA